MEGLKRRPYDQHDLGLQPIRAILLRPWKRHFTTLFPAWRSWQAEPKYKQKNFNQTAISWYLQKQVGIIACLMYSASVAFL